MPSSSYLPHDTSITTADDKDLLGLGVGVEGDVGHHLVVDELILVSELDGTVEDENGSPGTLVLEDGEVLELGLGGVLDLEGHGLAGPHNRLFTEPSILLKTTHGGGGGRHSIVKVLWGFFFVDISIHFSVLKERKREKGRSNNSNIIDVLLRWVEKEAVLTVSRKYDS